MNKRTKLRIKPFVLPTLYLSLITLLMISVYYEYDKNLSSKNIDEKDAIEDVVDITPIEEEPVVQTEEVLIRPYNSEDDKIKVGKSFYDYQADAKDQANALIFYQNTYMQNSGVDYVSDEEFEVYASFQGEVVKVENNELLGYVVEIKHDNNIITSYQSLSSTTLKKGDKVIQGEVVGKSGKSKINSDLGNHLHFEMFKNGQVVNPENYYDKTIKDI